MSTTSRSLPRFAIAMCLAALAGVTLGPLPSRASPAAGHVVDGRMSDWSGESSMVGGQMTVSDGEVIYQDYVYDDAGSDGGAENHLDYRASGEPDGDYQYPNETERCRFNCADLLEFRATLEGDRVHFLVRLNTLLAKDSTVAGIALGPARQEGGASHAWPLGANISTPGSRHVLTLWGSGGKFDGADLASVGGEVAAGLEHNVIEASVPVDLVGKSFRAYVATGLWDKANNEWMAIQSSADQDSPGGGSPERPRIFNVAFRPGEIGFWYERHQSTALAARDISAFHADIDLNEPDSRPQPPPRGVWQERIVESAATIPPGEGVLPEYPTTGNYPTEAYRGRGYYGGTYPTRFHYLGRLQPYSLYVPEQYERAVLANHPGGYAHGLNTLSPHYDWLAEDAKAVMVTPLARGPYSFCTDYAHLDVLEAWEDALSLFPHGSLNGKEPPKRDFIDTDRNMLWGYSMGGLCTARLAVLHPDMFASAAQWAASSAFEEDNEPVDSKLGHPGNGYPVDLMVNTRGMTWRINHCVADEIAPYAGVLPHVNRLEELKYEYTFRSMYGCDHLAQEFPQTGPAYVRYTDDATETASARLDRNPVHVTYKTAEAWWRPDISRKLVFDHAYWVSALRTRDKSAGLKAYGTVDAVTHGLGGEEPTTEPFTRAGTMAIFPYTETGREFGKGARVKKANAFEASLTNLRATTFDLNRMGLTTAQPLKVTLQTDGKSEVSLAGAAGAKIVKCKPRPCPRARADGKALMVSLPDAGKYELTIGRGSGSGGARDEGPEDESPEDEVAAQTGSDHDSGVGERGVASRAATEAGGESPLAVTGAAIAALLMLGLALTTTGFLMNEMGHHKMDSIRHE